MPFFILICAGVIVVLFWNLKKAIFDSPSTEAAYMHLVSGNVEMKAWGTDDFFDRSTDGVIMTGDEIKTSADARLIVEFFDGTIMRVGGSTDIEFSNINQDSENPSIDLILRNGRLWFNQIFKSTDATEVRIISGEVVVNSGAASVFELENDVVQTLRVISVFDNEGAILDVTVEGDDETVVESENVGIGQELAISAAVLDKYWAHQSPSVLSGIDDDFKNSAWYKWNIKEDAKPTEFKKESGAGSAGLIKVSPELVESPEEAVGPDDTEPIEDVDDSGVEDLSPDDADAEPDEVTEDVDSAENLGDLAAPEIATVSGGTQTDENGFYHVSGNVATISGSVSGASKVVVNGYTLSKFKPGDTTWTYFANADFNLMKEGENLYEVVAYDANSKASQKLVVKVYYTPKKASEEPATAAAPAADNSGTPAPEASDASTVE
ncbi:hypothetical protein HY605_02530 [Candidatus Peregrinibacteria bacterium]|nr:hypothetical protein [Candidatus Peregrinibacteria bacterium]